jgi:hypothetical protein
MARLLQHITGHILGPELSQLNPPVAKSPLEKLAGTTSSVGSRPRGQPPNILQVPVISQEELIRRSARGWLRRSRQEQWLILQISNELPDRVPTISLILGCRPGTSTVGQMVANKPICAPSV